jgi:hypothetical protein
MRTPDREPDGVNPTARWLARGLWKLVFALVAIFLVAAALWAFVGLLD